MVYHCCDRKVETILHGVQEDKKDMQIECAKCGQKINYEDYRRHLAQCHQKDVSCKLLLVF